MPWLEQTSDDFGPSASESFSYRFEPRTAPDRILLQGPCPRCQEHFTFDWPLEVVQAQVSVDVEENEVPVTVYCQCTGSHPGRPPEEKQGCGAYWNLLVPEP
jgi:hypothetical protein